MTCVVNKTIILIPISEKKTIFLVPGRFLLNPRFGRAKSELKLEASKTIPHLTGKQAKMLLGT